MTQKYSMSWTAIEPPEGIWARPPILHVTAALGLSDAEVARSMGVHPVTVNQWAHGARPIPPTRFHALVALVLHMIACLSKMPSQGEREDRRRKMARDVAGMWLDLAQDERMREAIAADHNIDAAGRVAGETK
jgi:transcriptional regulator with XRE-family HTH domain